MGIGSDDHTVHCSLLDKYDSLRRIRRFLEHAWHIQTLIPGEFSKIYPCVLTTAYYRQSRIYTELVGIGTCLAGGAVHGKVTKILVPELSDSILISPLNWRTRSCIPLIPTPVPCD